MSDIYYAPDDFGIETVAEFELSEPCYSFDIVLVQRDKISGLFYVNTDSGCSCPTPFEDYNDRASLGEPLDAHKTAAKIRQLVADRWDKDYRPEYLPAVSAVMSAPKVVQL